MSQTQPEASAGSPGLLAWGVRAVAHCVGVVSVATALLAYSLDWLTLEAIWASAQHADFLALSVTELALHVGLAACLWALVVIGFEIATARRQPIKTVFKVARGSVMTETLVILPIFLLLTFGIAQLAINNMAGLVANTAVFQAGRTVWLWSSEVDAGRGGVDSDKVKRLARAQAAAVLTPVAPGEFVQNPGGLSSEARQMRGILLGSQLPSFSQDTGGPAMTAASGFLAGDNMTNLSGVDSQFARSFDESSFRHRTVRKFTFAFHATEIDVINGDEPGVSLKYHHHQAMPMVGAIFGDRRTDIGSRPGHYSTIEREFTMPKQIPPNPVCPSDIC